MTEFETPYTTLGFSQALVYAWVEFSNNELRMVNAYTKQNFDFIVNSNSKSNNIPIDHHKSDKSDF